MPRTKKTENVASEATQEITTAVNPTAAVKPTKEDLRTACIELGLRICKDFDKGVVRPEAELVNAVTELFKAVNYKE